MANTIKPNTFPQLDVLTGEEELYTQTGGINNKFTVNQIIQKTNDRDLVPLEFPFVDVNVFVAVHNRGRMPIVKVMAMIDGYEEEIDVDIRSDDTETIMNSNSNITGTIYIY